MSGDQYDQLSSDIKGKLSEELTDHLLKLNKAKENMATLMESMANHKLPNFDSHNFMIETIRTQLEVSLDNLDNAIYQTNEILDKVKAWLFNHGLYASSNC